MAFTREQIIGILETVRDPEVPVLSVVDLGLVRDVQIDGENVVVKLTPTYSGCPALEVIERSVVDALRDKGIPRASVERVLSPAWTTDWMSEQGKQKLKEYGIAPPGRCADEPLISIGVGTAPHISCPFCDSQNTERRSQFGSTACKALYYCNACRQPFEHFKAI